MSDWNAKIIDEFRANAGEVGTETTRVKAREAEGDERDQLWEAVKSYRAGFADYEQKTSRVIPVVVLERVD